MDIDAVAFVQTHNRAVLVTHRKDGGLQASPIRVLVNEGDHIVATTRSITAKARNLSRDARFTLCVMSDAWQGDWITVEGNAKVHCLPAALDELRAFYLARDGKVAAPEEFATIMDVEQRVMLHFDVERTSGIVRIP